MSIREGERKKRGYSKEESEVQNEMRTSNDKNVIAQYPVVSNFIPPQNSEGFI
jgi:hypothetical protein